MHLPESLSASELFSVWYENSAALSRGLCWDGEIRGLWKRMLRFLSTRYSRRKRRRSKDIDGTKTDNQQRDIESDHKGAMEKEMQVKDYFLVHEKNLKRR